MWSSKTEFTYSSIDMVKSRAKLAGERENKREVTSGDVQAIVRLLKVVQIMVCADPN
jgi:hypothetical protein